MTVGAAITHHSNSPHKLRATNVGVRSGGVVAVSGFNLELNSGELVALVGRQDAGKTTCIDVLSGFREPSEGELTLDGTRLPDGPERACELGVARTFEELRLFDGLSVLDNVRTAMHLRSQARLSDVLLATTRAGDDELRQTARAEALLERAGLLVKAPLPARALSHPERVRLAIMRALATGPCFLLLDEPLAALERHETDGVLALIRRIRSDFGAGVLITDDDLPRARSYAERAIVLDRGATLASGVPGELATDEEALGACVKRS